MPPPPIQSEADQQAQERHFSELDILAQEWAAQEIPVTTPDSEDNSTTQIQPSHLSTTSLGIRKQAISENSQLESQCLASEKELPMCGICKEVMTMESSLLPCGHSFDFHCIISWVDHVSSAENDLNRITCPMCRTNIVTIHHHLQIDGTFQVLNITDRIRGYRGERSGSRTVLLGDMMHFRQRFGHAARAQWGDGWYLDIQQQNRTRGHLHVVLSNGNPVGTGIGVSLSEFLARQQYYVKEGIVKLIPELAQWVIRGLALERESTELYQRTVDSMLVELTNREEMAFLDLGGRRRDFAVAWESRLANLREANETGHLLEVLRETPVYISAIPTSPNEDNWWTHFLNQFWIDALGNSNDFNLQDPMDIREGRFSSLPILPDLSSSFLAGIIIGLFPEFSPLEDQSLLEEEHQGRFGNLYHFFEHEGHGEEWQTPEGIDLETLTEWISIFEGQSRTQDEAVHRQNGIETDGNGLVSIDSSTPDNVDTVAGESLEGNLEEERLD